MAIPDGRLNDVQETSEYDIARGTKKQCLGIQSH